MVRGSKLAVDAGEELGRGSRRKEDRTMGAEDRSAAEKCVDRDGRMDRDATSIEQQRRSDDGYVL